MPPSSYPSCLLAQHEKGLFKEAQDIMRSFGMKNGNHRSDDFNRLILPVCEPLIKAIANRLSYEAAVQANVDQSLVDIYESIAIQEDASWYVEKAGLSRQQILEGEDAALNSALPHISTLLNNTGAEPYCSAPIIQAERWDRFVLDLPKYGSLNSKI